MKRQGGGPKLTGDERIHESGGGSSLLKRLLELQKAKPPVVNTEAIKAANKAFASEVKTEFNVAISQILGVELVAGKAHSLEGKSEAKPKKEVTQVTESFIEYKASLNGRESRREMETSNQIRGNIEMILLELKKLKESSDEMESAFKDVVIDDVPQKPGIYHLRFFEGFLKIVVKLREKVDDASVFAKLFKGRKQERSYSAMAKKKGTSFTLHHDRAVATQTG